jgi:hypothetical protein
MHSYFKDSKMRFNNEILKDQTCQSWLLVSQDTWTVDVNVDKEIRPRNRLVFCAPVQTHVQDYKKT